MRLLVSLPAVTNGKYEPLVRCVGICVSQITLESATDMEEEKLLLSSWFFGLFWPYCCFKLSQRKRRMQTPCSYERNGDHMLW